MAIAASKRAAMTLYSSPGCLFCHQILIVLAEKGISVEVINVQPGEKPSALLEINPYATVPTLIDRDLFLYDLYNANILFEYLDERFPHPPLLPVYPVARARSRLTAQRIQQDWYNLLNDLETGSEEKMATATKQLHESLANIAPIFAKTPFFLSDEFSFIDCSLAPLLWRLLKVGFEYNVAAQSVKVYAERLFERASFKTSIAEIEPELEYS